MLKTRLLLNSYVIPLVFHVLRVPWLQVNAFFLPAICGALYGVVSVLLSY